MPEGKRPMNIIKEFRITTARGYSPSSKSSADIKPSFNRQTIVEFGRQGPAQQRGTMNDNTPAYFDLETVALLREVLEDAWASLRPDQRATKLKSTLAERILGSAAQGERDRERLLDAALSGYITEEA